MKRILERERRGTLPGRNVRVEMILTLERKRAVSNQGFDNYDHLHTDHIVLKVYPFSSR